MKLRNVFILLAIFIVLGGYVYFVEVKQYEKEQQRKEEAKQIFNFEKDSIDALNIKNLNGNFVIEKNQNEWKITDPIQTDADETVINSMLSSLERAKKEKTFNVNPDELPNYGLGNRAIFVKVGLKNGKQDSLWFGEKTPVGSYIFGNKTDTTVFTTSQSIKTSFDKKLFDLRNKKLLEFKQADVRIININNPYGNFEFEKTGSSDWTIKNINRPGDSGKLSGILSKLQNGRAKEFVDEEGAQLGEYGLNNPAYQVELLLGAEKGQKKLFISRKINGNYYAKDDARKPIFRIDSSVVQDIDKSINEFRDKDFASFEKTDVNRLVLAYNDTLFTAVKDTADNWRLEGDPQTQLKQDKIQTFFSDLDFTNVKEFVKDGNFNAALYGFNNPKLKIQLYLDENLILEAKFGKLKNDDIYATNNLYDSVYLISKSRLEKLKLNLNDLIKEPPSSDTLAVED